MKRFYQTAHLLGLMIVALIFTACSNSSSGGSTGEGSLSLSLSAPSLSIPRGGNDSLEVTLSSNSEMVALTLSGDTVGITAAFEPSSTAATSTLSLRVAPSATTGVRTLHVEGRSGEKTASAALVLTIASLNQAQDPAFTERYSSKLGEIKTFKLGDIEFQYEVIEGVAVYQGDMIIGLAADLEQTQQSFSAQGVAKDDGATCRRVNLRFCPFRGVRWPNGVVPYVVDSAYPAPQRPQVEALMREAAGHYRETTSIRLVPRSGQGDYLVVKNPSDPNVCGSSHVGVEGGAQTLNLLSSADLGCAVHELGHALGLAHEQSREDRDALVTINSGNIRSGYASNFDKKPARLFSDYGDYDVDSLMHYWAGAFSTSAAGCSAANTSGCTIVPRDSGIDLNRLGQRGGLSLGDRETLCELYGTQANARILGPSNGSRFAVGDEVELYGRYTLRGVEEPTQMRWSSSLDGELRTTEFPRGDRIRISNLSPGTHTLTLEALQGCPGVSNAVTITVSGEQSLNIVSPAEGSSFARGAVNIPFRADTVGFGARPSVRWESSLDGVLGESTDEISRSNLSIGSHTITATAASGSATLSDSVNITVTGSDLRVELLEPTGTEPFCADEPVTFRASVYDPSERSYENVPDANIVWRLERTIIGTGREFSRSFAVTGGDITVAATNAAGSSGTDAIYFLTRACTDNAPEVVITTPTEDSGVNDSVFAYDGFDEAKGMWYTDVNLAGRATDTEDGTLPGSALVWTTNQGELQAATLGSGSSLTTRLYSDACTGKQHEITLTATDSAGNVRTVLRRITIWTLC